MLEVTLRARCYPTEDREIVTRAIQNLFPDAMIEGDDPIIGRSGSLDAFAEALKRQRIRDSARAVFRRGISGNTTEFRLNKQVAAIGKVSFSEESHALGDIEVSIVSDDIRSLMDKIAPDTRKEKRS